MSKIKIRIAIAIDDKGDWSCAGWKSDDIDYDMASMALEVLDYPLIAKTVWLTAEVDPPFDETIEATVTDQE